MELRTERQIAGIERELLLEGLFRCYGLDFRDYAPGSLTRRIRLCMQGEGFNNLSRYQEKLLRDRGCRERFVLALSVHVTSMFRDPGFYRALREKIVPQLRERSFLRIWHAGCSTGEEAYSMAILLSEEGLYRRCRIYATDMNEEALSRAKAGIFDLDAMRGYTANYQQAGGKASFGDYYTARYENAILHASLQENIVFARHNLVTDDAFHEFDVIVCRNVMIYFNRPLQTRVFRLFHESLTRRGILGIGQKETLDFSAHRRDYVELDAAQKLYRRVH